MRYFLFILFTAVSFAQNAKVTAYRAFSESTKEPCSIKDFIKSREYGMVFTAESNDPNLIKSLQKVKKNSLKWKKEKFNCAMESSLPIYNMFVIENGNDTDTIFTTKNNYSIVLPEQKIQFIDKKHKLNKSLYGDMKTFFQRDFNKDIMTFETGNLDSISANKVIFQGKLYAEVNTYTIISINANFSYAPDDSIKKLNGMKYIFSTYTITTNEEFMEESRVDDILYLSADKIRIGDPESILLEKYPNSTKYRYPYSTKYENIKNNYGYGVKIREKKGFVIFEIKDKKINTISIYIP